MRTWIRKAVALGLGCLFLCAAAGCGEGKNQKLGGNAPMLDPSEVKNVEMGGPSHPKPPAK
jgi:hypothetical protein